MNLFCKNNLPAAGPAIRRGKRRWLLALALPLALWAAVVALPTKAADDDEPIPPRIATEVDNGLAWLARGQQRDGSWAGGGGGGNSRSAAVTGLCAMAFMARGHVPGQGPYGENLNHAVDYILSVQAADGVMADAGLSQPMYDHGICTIMLCEAYGMLDEGRQAKAKRAIANAVRLILNAQALPKSAEAQGGWRYTPTSRDSDLSVSGWQLMALRGAANAGADIPPGALKAGIDYVKHRATVNGAFAYTGASATTPALTATGVLTLCLLGQPNAPEVSAGGDFLLRNNADKNTSHYYYTVYYCCQAAWQLGIADRKYWVTINGNIASSLADKQLPDGAWPTTDSDSNRGGEAYATAMSILALTVPYRYLPIYQR